MTHITEHHSEKEWESNNRDWYWIGLQISWHTICIDNQLENSCEIGGLEVSGPWD